jgi:exodeoxyribonuclease V alpha subunit
MVVVTPTLKAAQVAAVEVGAAAGSAAWLAFQHGWRWTESGAWTRLNPGRADPVTGGVYTGPEDAARLHAGDLLVVDEAGMLDQDTARALLTVADESRARVALLGDRHQLAAVGRGGVLDLAVRHVDPAAVLTLDRVHRFTRTDHTGATVPDGQYAELTLAMRAGADPGAVFDALAARGRIRLHPDAAAAQEALAALAEDAHCRGERVAVVVDTREQAAELNAAIRDRLVAAGQVDDTEPVTTRTGQRIGIGDRIATRRNDRDLGVANRDTWTVTAIDGHRQLTIVPADAIRRRVGERLLPVDYVAAQVELAYACTAHGAQGDTVSAAHLVIGEHSGAATAYVGMTRGRTANTAHLVAADLSEARQQWIAVFGRDRADLGPAHAAGLAAREAAHYAQPRPLDQVLADLHAAWTAEQRFLDRLAIQEPLRDALRQSVALEDDQADRLPALEADYRQAAAAARLATARAEVSGAAIAVETDRIRDGLHARWDGEWAAARAAAQVVLAGPGRLRLRQAAVTRAADQLTDWAHRWRPYLPSLPTDPHQVAEVADRADDRTALWTAFAAAARSAAESAHPEHEALRTTAHAAQHAHEQAWRALAEAHRQRSDRLAGLGALASTADPKALLLEVDRDLAATHGELSAVRARIARLVADPALLVLPADRRAQEHAL